jgi:hypothetical protein
VQSCPFHTCVFDSVSDPPSLFVFLSFFPSDLHKDFFRDDPEGSCERVVRINRVNKSSNAPHPSPPGTTPANQGKNSRTHSAVDNYTQSTTLNDPTGSTGAISGIRSMMGGVSSCLVFPMKSMTTTNCPHQYTPTSNAAPPLGTTNVSSDLSSDGNNTISHDSESSQNCDSEPIPLDFSDDDGSSDYSSRPSAPISLALLRDFLNDYPPETLKEEWKIDGLHGYEPRTIQQMVATPNLWYNYCPSLSPEQQVIMEHMMPFSLPIGFYVTEITWWGHLYAWFLVGGHSIQTVCTNFGGTAWYYTDLLGALQHVAIDQLWNHIIVSLFILLGPPVFGPYCKILATVLVPARTVVLCCDIKSHFLTNVRRKAIPNMAHSIQDFGPRPSSTTKDRKPSTLVSPTVASHAEVVDRILEYQLGRHIRLISIWYILASTLLILSVGMDNIHLQVLAVIVMNLGPIIADVSYGQRFSSRLQLLPPKQRPVVKEGSFLLPKGLIPWLASLSSSSSSLNKSTTGTTSASSFVSNGKQKIT